MQLPPQTRVAGRAEGNESPDRDQEPRATRSRVKKEERHAPEITYDEQFYPARPRRFRPSARRSLRRRISDRLTGDGDGAPVADNRAYVEWLVEESMLADANRLASQLSGQGSMWQNPYAHPDPRAALERASVWFTAYPLSFVTRRGETFLSALADPALWQAFRAIGIDGVHTGPVKQAGGLNGRRLTPSVDGHFDRICMSVDPEFGTEDEFRRLCATAAEYEGTVIDDIVPGHTGKGADFRLAEMGYGDYPGIYHMVSIREDDWHLLPEVPEGRDSVNLDGATELALERAGYIIGRLQRVIFYEPGVKETNWSATRAVTGVDGVAAPLGLPALLQGGPAVDQLARPVLRRHAAGDRRRAARAGRPGVGRAAAGRQRLPRRREDRRGLAGVVGGAPALRGRQPPDREHDPQDGRVLLPGAQPGHGRHQVDGGVRRGPVLRLRHAPRVPPRAGHGRHRVPAADA